MYMHSFSLCNLHSSQICSADIPPLIIYMTDIEAPGYFRELKAEGYVIYILLNNDHILSKSSDIFRSDMLY